MTTQEAMRIIKELARGVRVTWDEHQILQRALAVIEAALKQKQKGETA